MKLTALKSEDVNNHLGECLNFRINGTPERKRYSSYDYCYNYFRDFYVDGNKENLTNGNNLHMGCLHLGHYLASWGMYRGSGALHRRSFRIYEGLIKRISEEVTLWEIDVEDYCYSRNDANIDTIKAINDFKEDVKKLLSDDYNEIKTYKCINFDSKLVHKSLSVSDILSSKIMMGVFGCVPAFDSYFKSSLVNNKFNEKLFNEIYDFYDKHKILLDKYQKDFKTLDVNGGLTQHTYKKAKMIDVIGFRIKEQKEG
ncbi:hypothetical protein RE476_04385 [Methanolobus mangrovi]|uniref:Uncharacterized protein n=1 Tax=Methanolobus mangrovi TaxID=3072977 RepID=A0AA51YJY2_9EURY|nr:hypothetical protein [Methanolobus mangrovi]WMW23073.1 hypothetical protein RE476_04385 [Methanolobus mangrovi]